MDSQSSPSSGKNLSYFLSPVAIIFLAIFLFATMFIFFTLAKFFAEIWLTFDHCSTGFHLADFPRVRADDANGARNRNWHPGNLLTLPLKTSHLVLGKFFAGMSLWSALAFTCHQSRYPTGRSGLGPVVGGYVAALLLASSYMAIGLCVSSRTDNQIVTPTDLVIGGYHSLFRFGRKLLQWTPLKSFAPSEQEVAFRARAGADVRDFFYYGSLTTFF